MQVRGGNNPIFLRPSQSPLLTFSTLRTQHAPYRSSRLKLKPCTSPPCLGLKQDDIKSPSLLSASPASQAQHSLPKLDTASRGVGFISRRSLPATQQHAGCQLWEPCAQGQSPRCLAEMEEPLPGLAEMEEPPRLLPNSQALRTSSHESLTSHVTGRCRSHYTVSGDISAVTTDNELFPRCSCPLSRLSLREAVRIGCYL